VLSAGTAKVVVWKSGKLLKAVLSGKGSSVLDFDLQLGIPQGTVAAKLESGLLRVCMQCDPYQGKDGSDGKKFFAKQVTCPAPSNCP
jgi:hypothetical protein